MTYLLLIIFSGYSLNLGEFDTRDACVNAGVAVIRSEAVQAVHKKKTGYICLSVEMPKQMEEKKDVQPKS